MKITYYIKRFPLYLFWGFVLWNIFMAVYYTKFCDANFSRVTMYPDPFAIVLTVDNVGKVAGRDTVQAMAQGIVVLVNKEDEYNSPYLAHELTHVRQYYRTLGFNTIYIYISH